MLSYHNISFYNQFVIIYFVKNIIDNFKNYIFENYYKNYLENNLKH